MKKNTLFKILSVIILISNYGPVTAFNDHHSKAVNKQNFNQDTIKLLHSRIVMNKTKFRHQPLNTLLQELHLTVKAYNSLSGSKPSTPSGGVMLFFENPTISFNKMHDKTAVPFLIVYFENEIPRLKAIGLFSRTQGKWNDEAIAFYGPMIVKDIDENKK